MTCNTTRSATLLVAAGLSLVTAVAGAEEFEGGHIFVSGSNPDGNTPRISEFDAEGVHVRDIDLAPGEGRTTGFLYGIAFGPDGRLYASVYTDDRIDRVAPDGTSSTLLEPGSGVDAPSFITFGPDGVANVASRNTDEVRRVFETDLGTEAQAELLPSAVSLPDSVSFLPSGRRVISSTFGGTVQAIDPTGTFAARLDRGTGIGDYGGNAVESRDGTIFMAGFRSDHILAMSPAGTSAALPDVSGLAGPFAMTRRENGNLLVGNYNDGSVREYTQAGVLGPSIVYDGIELPAGIAIAPFAFEASIKGAFALDEGGFEKTKKLRARGVRLSVDVDGGVVMLSFPPTNDLDAEELLGPVIVARGHVMRRAGDTKRRMIHASVSPQSGSVSADDHIEITLELKGSENTNGRFIPKKARGTLHASAISSVFGGTIKAKRVR